MNTFFSRHGYSIQAKGWTYFFIVILYYHAGIGAHVWAHNEPLIPVLFVLTVYAMVVEKFINERTEFLLALSVSAIVDLVCVVNEAVRRDFAADLIPMDHSHVSFPAEVFLTMLCILAWRKIRRTYL